MESTALQESREILYLSVDQIRPNPYQPRKLFDRNGLDELADSIREYGIMQPISVRLINGCSYELVAGERRLRASKIAGLQVVPVIVVNITDQDSAILAIIENLQRQNLNYLEEADGFQNLMHDYSFTQDELARRIGKSQSAIANKLRILKLSKTVQKFLLEHGMSERHARALLRLDEEDAQLEVLQKVVKHGLNVKKTEELIDSVIAKRKEKQNPKSTGRVRQVVKDVRLFTNTIKQAVDVMIESGVDTNYTMTETDDEYEIKITVSK